MRNKFGTAAVGAFVARGLAACGGGGAGAGNADDGAAGGGDAAAEEGGTIGVSMPTQTSERWIADGAAVEEGLTSCREAKRSARLTSRRDRTVICASPCDAAHGRSVIRTGWGR